MATVKQFNDRIKKFERSLRSAKRQGNKKRIASLEKQISSLKRNRDKAGKSTKPARSSSKASGGSKRLTKLKGMQKLLLKNQAKAVARGDKRKEKNLDEALRDVAKQIRAIEGGTRGKLNEGDEVGGKFRDRAAAETINEMVEDGVLPEDALSDDDLFDFVSKQLEPFYKRQKGQLKKKFKIQGRARDERISAELGKLADDKELYVKQYHTRVDRVTDLAVKLTGRTKEDLSDELERVGVLGERERRNIREGFNSSGRFKSSERLQAESESLEDQQFAEGQLEKGAERQLGDIDQNKREELEDLELLKQGRINDFEFQRRQALRERKFGAQSDRLQQEVQTDELERQRFGDITQTVRDIRDIEAQREGLEVSERLRLEQPAVDDLIGEQFGQLTGNKF